MKWVKNFFSSGRGSDILLPAVIGLLAYFLLKPSRKNPNSLSPTSRLIEDQLIAAGLTPRTARMWRAVSQFETGDYKSRLAIEENNLFGMKHPISRETLSIRTTDSGFASFASPSDSVADLVLYMREFNYPVDFDSVDSLVAFMKSKGYFEEPLNYYLEGVQVYVNS